MHFPSVEMFIGLKNVDWVCVISLIVTVCYEYLVLTKL